MKKTFILYLSSVLLCLCGCEHEIPFERLNDDATLSMTGLLSTTDSLHKVYVSYSTAEEVLEIPDPRLFCYINGQLVAEGSKATGGSSYAMEFKAQFHAGETMRLVLTALGGELSAEVEEVVPQPAEITHVEMANVTSKKGLFYINLENFLQLRITVKDRPGEANYYFPSLSTRYTKTMHYQNSLQEEKWKSLDAEQTIPLYGDYNDFILNEGIVQVDNGDEIFGTIVPNTYMAFSDALFSNSEGTISVLTYPHWLSPWYYSDLYPDEYSSHMTRYSTNRRLCVRIHSMDERYYRYLKALNTLDSDNYEPAIVDPITLPSNVHGGVGFVGISCAAIAEIELEDEVIEDDLYY
ncbi:MAG: DUF4249 family protein [Bacteroidaceae bacterium]|nr:DUF4249 family protein [Bacteroidaceae bacterium]